MPRSKKSPTKTLAAQGERSAFEIAVIAAARAFKENPTEKNWSALIGVAESAIPGATKVKTKPKAKAKAKAEPKTKAKPRAKTKLTPKKRVSKRASKKR